MQTDDNESFDLYELLSMLFEMRRLVAVLMIGAAVAGYLTSHYAPERYRALVWVHLPIDGIPADQAAIAMRLAIDSSREVEVRIEDRDISILAFAPTAHEARAALDGARQNIIKEADAHGGEAMRLFGALLRAADIRERRESIGPAASSLLAAAGMGMALIAMAILRLRSKWRTRPPTMYRQRT